MLLADALQIGRDKVIVLVGGGGKTTTMYRLARELSDLGRRVVVTTTTRIVIPEPGQAGHTIVGQDLRHVCSRIRQSLAEHSVVGLGFEIVEGGKLRGIPPEWVAKIAGLVDHVLVEADGAAERPFKAPADYEPVIPECADLVVAVVGVEAVGTTLVRENVHRPERIQAITGLQAGAVVTPDVVAQVLLHPLGIAKGAPRGARVVALINKVEDDHRLAVAREIGHRLIAAGMERVIVGQVRSEPPVVEIMT